MERTPELEREAWDEIERIREPGEEWRLCPSFWQFGVSDRGRILRYLQAAGKYSGRAGWQLDQTLKITQVYQRVAGGMFLHTLVADAFLGPRPGSFVIDHIDCNKLNNHPSNLRYISSSENTLRAQSPEVRSQQVKTQWANRTPEQRRELALKSANTRRLRLSGALPEATKRVRTKVERPVLWEKFLSKAKNGGVQVLREVFQKNKKLFIVRTIDRCYKIFQVSDGGSLIDLTSEIHEALGGSKFNMGAPRRRYQIVEGKLLFKEGDFGENRVSEFIKALSEELYDGRTDALDYEVA